MSTGSWVAGLFALSVGGTSPWWLPTAVDGLVYRRMPTWQRPVMPVGAAIGGVIGVAAGTGVVALRFSHRPAVAAVVWGVFAVAFVASVVDFQCHRLPDMLTAPLWATMWPTLVVLAVTAGEHQRIAAGLVAAGVSAAALGAGWLVGMGLGDVKFGAVLALVVGWCSGTPGAAIAGALVVVGGAAVLSVLWVALRWLVSGTPVRDVYAFGPWLAGSAAVVVVGTGLGVSG